MKSLLIASLMASSAVLASAAVFFDICINEDLSGDTVLRPSGGDDDVFFDVNNCNVADNSLIQFSPNGLTSTTLLIFSVHSGSFGAGSRLLFTDARNNSSPMLLSVQDATFVDDAHIAFDPSFVLPGGSSVRVERNTFGGTKAGTGQTYACPIFFSSTIEAGGSGDVTIIRNKVLSLGQKGADNAVGVRVNIPTGMGLVWLGQNEVTIAGAASSRSAYPSGIEVNGVAPNDRLSWVHLSDRNVVKTLSKGIIGRFGIALNISVTNPPGSGAVTIELCDAEVTGDFREAPISVNVKGGWMHPDFSRNTIVSYSRTAQMRLVFESMGIATRGLFTKNKFVSETSRALLSMSFPNLMSPNGPTSWSIGDNYFQNSDFSWPSNSAPLAFIEFGAPYVVSSYISIAISGNVGADLNANPAVRLVLWPADATSGGLITTCGNVLNTVALLTDEAMAGATHNLPASHGPMAACGPMCIDPRNITFPNTTDTTTTAAPFSPVTTTTAQPPLTTGSSNSAPSPSFFGAASASALAALFAAMMAMMA